MPNIRIIYDNAASRATLSSSATVAGLDYTNLLKAAKSKVCRSTGKTLTITATFTTAETIGAVVLPFCNISAFATLQVQVYTNTGDASPAYDSTAQNALGGTPFLGSGVSGVNSFAYGGGAYARLWLPSKPVGKKVVITLSDTANTAITYVEASILVLGDYWEVSGTGAEQGATMTLVDNSKNSRTDAGDLVTDRGTRHRKQTFSLPDLGSTDRVKMWDVLWGNGMSVPVFISQYPNNADSRLEREHQLYGKLVVTPVMGTPYFNRQNASLDIEEV